MTSVWSRLKWMGIFRISCELQIPKKISFLTHQVIAFLKLKVIPVAAVKTWHSCQFSPRSYKEADRNGNVTSGWWAGSSGSVMHCPVLLLWVCLGYRYSSAHQGPCSLQIPRDLWELTSFPCPAEELGEIPYLQLWNFVNPTARQKHKHQHCQQQFLPARQSKVPRNVLSEVPVVPSSHQFCIYTVLPQFKTHLSTMKKMIIFCHWCNSALSIYLCQAGLVCARFHYGCMTVGA